MSAVYVDGLLVDLLRTAVAPAGMFTLQPVDLLTRLPCVVAKHIGGGGAVDVRFASTRALVQIDAYHPVKRGAFDLADTARAALILAWRTGIRTGNGGIARLLSVSDPTELRLPEQAGGFTRYVQTLELIVR